jgi:hypothetical protein
MGGAYRPSCVLNFKLKFDEALTLKPVVQTVLRTAGGKNVTAIVQGEPLILDRGSDDADSFVYQRVPKMCSVEMNGYRVASRFTAQFDWRQIPLDPRSIRAASCEIHMGAVSDDDFRAGVIGPSGQGGLALLSQLKTRNTDGTANDSTLKMVGFIDDWEVAHSDKGSEVTIEGRDLRGILLDTPLAIVTESAEEGIDMLNRIDWSLDIRDVVGQILSFNSFFDAFQVWVNPEDWPGGKIPSPGYKDIVPPREKKGAKEDKTNAAAHPAGDAASLNYWDLIVRASYLVGAIPFVDGLKIGIRPAATVFDKARGPLDPVRNPTPFRGGKPRLFDQESHEQLGTPLVSRRLVYGRDTQTLRLGRKQGGWRKPKTIRCICENLDSSDPTARLVEGIWPPQSETKAKAQTAAPGQNKAKEDVVNVPVHGVPDVKRLTEIAHSIYEEIGRGEVGGACSTVKLSSFGGDNADPDLLSLKPGDGVEIFIDSTRARTGFAPVTSTLIELNRNSFDAQVDVVFKELGDRNLARIAVATSRGLINELQSFFRVQNVKFNWDWQSGVKIDFDFQNYVIARAQVGKASVVAGVAEGIATLLTKGKLPPFALGNR